MDLVNRLKFFMDSRKLTISQFADTCGIPRPTMSQLMNGRNKRISDEIINKIHNGYPSLSILWLMFGEGEMETQPNIKISEPQNAPVSVDVQMQNPLNKDNTEPLRSVAPMAPDDPEKSMMEDSLFETPKFGDDSNNFAEAVTPYPLAGDFEREIPKTNISFDTTSDNLSSRGLTDAGRPREFAPEGRLSDIAVDEARRNDTASDITRTLGRSDAPSAGRSYTAASNGSISISPDSRKKITNIVVFYSDNSFQSFLPDS